MNNYKKLNQDGFSLVQVMVAVGLMGGLALAMMKMTDNQIKSQKTMELKAEQGDLANIIRQTLNDKVACEATFIGMTPGDDIDTLRMTADMAQPPFAEVGKKFKTYNVFIKSMHLLTRAEELTHKQRETGSNPITDYTSGTGFGYLKVTFVKNMGAVTDTNKNHNFFGAKETSSIFQVKGFFYDMEIVKHNDPAKLDQACFDKADDHGVVCTASSHERCSNVPLNEDGNDGNGTIDFITDLNGVKLYLAECKYFRDDSPFMGCAN